MPSSHESDVAAPGLRTVDGVEILVLVDNVSDLISTVRGRSLSELSYLKYRNWRGPLQGQCLCIAHWGLSLLITVFQGSERRTILFDTGPEPYPLLRNIERLEVNLAEIEAVVLSHGHWDHVGGVTTATSHIRTANGGSSVPVYANARMFGPRGRLYPDGFVLRHEEVPSPDEIACNGGRLEWAEDATLLLDNMVYLSGEIPRVTDYERGLPGHVRLNAEKEWEPDPFLLDERYIAIRIREHGILVFTACGHAGIINTLIDAGKTFQHQPLYGLVGGFHLAGQPFESLIPRAVHDLEEFGLRIIIPSHCTGWRAVHAMVSRFGEDVVIPSAVGMLHRLGQVPESHT